MKMYLSDVSGEQRGPYSLSQVKAMWEHGVITSDVHYWAEGMEEWSLLTSLLDSSSEKNGGSDGASCTNLTSSKDRMEIPPPIPDLEEEPPELPATEKRQQQSEMTTRGVLGGVVEQFRSLPKFARMGIITGVLLALVIGILSGPSERAHSSGTPESTDTPQIITSAQIARELEMQLKTQKQQVFEQFHPVGTAKSVKVHDVSLEWRNGIPSANWGDLLKYVVRFTVYWEGPIEKDGFTKIEATWDNETQRRTDLRLLATNGIRNEQVRDGLIEFGIGFLGGYLESQSR